MVLLVADGLVGLSFGAVAVSSGLPAWTPILMSLTVFAGGAQFAAVGVLAAGGDPGTAILAGLLLNARLVPFGFAVAELIRGGLPLRLLGMQVVTDESTAFALAADPARRRIVYWTVGVGLFVVWNATTALGVLLGTLVGDTDALGLDAAFPALLLALVLPNLRERPLIAAVATGAVVAVAATPVVPPGTAVLVALAALVVVLPKRIGSSRSGGSA